MVNTSQPMNQSYGYLWWLSGKPSHMLPQTQFVFNGPLFSNAPVDMFSALGKDDQKIYVVPSQQLVVIRTGASAYEVTAAFSRFDDTLWSKINQLSYKCSYTFTGNGAWNVAANWTNNTVPPAILDKEATIIINPVAGGECILNIPQTISSGTNLKVATNAKFRIMGNLTIQQ